MLKRQFPLYIAFLAFLAVLIVCENQFSNSFQGCIGEYGNSQAATHSKDGGFIIGIIVTQAACTVHFINFHVGFFSVIAGALVAIFTYNLVESTDKLWKAGNKALETTERAFIFLDGFNVELTTAADAKVVNEDDLPERFKTDPGLYITRFAVQPRWKNGGNTPTGKMTILVNSKGPEGFIPPEYTYRAEARAFFVAPRAVEPSEVFEIPSVRTLVDYGLDPIGAEPIILIWGRAGYEDLFGNPHFTEWCYRVRMDRHDGQFLRASFIQWGAYNRTDHSD